MLAGLVIVPVVSLLTRAPDGGRVAEIFSCYEQTVTVTVKDSIGRSGEKRKQAGPIRQNPTKRH